MVQTSPELIISLVAVFLSVGLFIGALSWFALSARSPERQRLKEISQGRVSGLLLDAMPLSEVPSDRMQRLARMVPKSPNEMSRLRRRLGRAGYRSFSAAVFYAFSEILTPALLGGAVLLGMGVRRGWFFALLAAAIGYSIPALWLGHRISKRMKEIQNGLPDALDLFIICLEAGSSLDQAILKASDELEISYPALAEELRLIVTETRAGKPRLEAFKNFAQRTNVDDVRSLVAMLIQTDRFGTSIGQALRVHADTSRTKRRQRAEEKAHKVGVKLVFPLVLCLFPAFYLVTLAPSAIKIYRAFAGH
jgi:tight adherence protein C